MPTRILIAIPAFNEERFLGRLLDQLSATVSIDHILIVNDGSTDRTRELASSFGVHLVDHQKNSGKGEAIKTAFSFARAKKFDWILFLDGDGQHPPEYVPAFVEQIQNKDADVFLGNRQERTAKMPFHRQLSNGITSILISLCAGARILDSQCGYRAIRVEKAAGFCYESTGFQIESEMLLKLGKSGARFAHIPITTVYGQESSSIHLVADTLKFIKLLIKSFWW